MFRADPIARLLGKDVAQLIYLFLHQWKTEQLINEYYDYRVKMEDVENTWFRESNTSRGQFVFNFRSGPGHWHEIARWAVDGPGFMYNYCASIPNKYWYSSGRN